MAGREVVRDLGLVNRTVKRCFCHGTAILYGRVSCSLAVTSGVHTAADVLKCLLAGADVTMTASALLKHGPQHLQELLKGVREWMAENEYTSIEQMKGSMSQHNCPEPAAFERSQYMKMLTSCSGYNFQF